VAGAGEDAGAGVDDVVDVLLAALAEPVT
jgi:hypothetical protein